VGIGIYPTGVFLCQDGYVQTLIFPPIWERLVAAMDMPELHTEWHGLKRMRNAE
jgi:hypothetical protein